MMGNLFSKYFLSDFINAYRKGLMDDIDKLEITESTDLQPIIDRLIQKATIEPIEIQEAEPTEPRETTRKRKDIWDRLIDEKIYEIDVTIPFQGNNELFYCQPSTSTVVYLDDSATIHKHKVTATIVLTELDSNKYSSAVNKIIGTLKTNLPRIHSEIEPWNNGLENLIKGQIEKRKGIVSKKHDFMQKIGLKVNPSSEHFTPSSINKKKIPKPVSDTTQAVKKEHIPTLKEAVYKDIIEVLYNVGQAMERKPSLYVGKHEEDLRDVFLLFLETRYESASGVGEAFNKKGKTDILLKYSTDGSNIFVAECKFWRGQKKFLETIDQLLGYLTHRDSKTALMIFLDQKELTSVILSAREEIKNHPNFLRYVADSHETSIRYQFTLPEDKSKVIEMEVVFFHFPK
jgi:hypothetical protein